MLGVIHNENGFADAPCGVNVCDGEIRDKDDDLSSPNYPQQGLNTKLASNTSAQEAFNSPPIKYVKDGVGNGLFLAFTECRAGV